MLTMSENIGSESTEDSLNTQANEAKKTYTQEEVDNMMAKTRGSIERKYQKQYADLGDLDELRELKTAAEKRQQEEQIKRGEFEKTLQELASKKDSEIQKRDAIIKEYKVNTPLLNAAAKYKSVNPEQVQSLLHNRVRLNNDGDVEVIDSDGAVRYDDSGKLIDVDNLVREFLDKNPHFVQPTPSTTNTKNSSGVTVDTSFDLSKLDLTKPEHRKKYAEAKSKGLL